MKLSGDMTMAMDTDGGGNQQASSDGKHFLLALVFFTILSVLQISKNYCNHPNYKTIINKDLLIMTSYHKKKLNLGKR